MDDEKMTKPLSLCLIALLSTIFLATGCGDEDSESSPPAEWGEWENVLKNGEMPGEMVDGMSWEHYPEFRTDTEREFRYWEISTNRPVDAFIAPKDNCQQGAASETWSHIGELFIEDHGHELASDVNSGTPICVGFHAHLINEDGQWYIGVQMRERPRSD